MNVIQEQQRHLAKFVLQVSAVQGATAEGTTQNLTV